MVLVPTAAPSTVAVVGVTGVIGATPGLLLLHTPPPIPLVMVIVEPKHTLSGPPTGNGARIRNTDLSTLQPVGRV